MLSFLTYCSRYVIGPYPTVAEDFANAYICVILCTIYFLSTVFETEMESSVDYAVGSRLYYKTDIADYTIDHKTILQAILQTIL